MVSSINLVTLKDALLIHIIKVKFDLCLLNFDTYFALAFCSYYKI